MTRMPVICVLVLLSNSALAQQPAIFRLDTADKLNNAAAEWAENTGKELAVPVSTVTMVGISLVSLRAMLDAWPTIKLIVSPVPPRDYGVTVNGRRLRVTERGEYVVPRGTSIELVVTRQDVPPCHRKLVVNADVEVICRLP